MYRTRLASVAVVSMLAACADAPTAIPSSTNSAPDMAPSHTVSGDIWSRIIEGTTGEGSQYAIRIPAAWNGDVVYYAHGIKDRSEAVGLPNGDNTSALRDSLGAMGYAVAFSSFSENGWAVKDGIERTHQLRGLFTSKVRKPRRSYIIGTSLGGLIAVGLAEKYGNEYDGAMPMCGVLGGGQKQIDYLANVRTLFDVFYPNVLPGNALSMPDGLDLNVNVLGPSQAAILAAPTAAVGLMPRFDQTPIPGANPPEIIQSVLTALAYGFRGADDMLDRTHGHSPFDNSAPGYYTTTFLPPQFALIANANAARFTETPDAANYLQRYYEPSGEITMPTVSIHTTRDPVVPIFHEAIYATKAANAGRSNLLLQRTVPAYGHCTFTPKQTADAFRALAQWVETGVKPAN